VRLRTGLTKQYRDWRIERIGLRFKNPIFLKNRIFSPLNLCTIIQTIDYPIITVPIDFFVLSVQASDRLSL
jgi:hypothetical protein